MKPFDSEDFRYFAVLARTLNLSEAARVLRTSSATVLRRVRALEESLDTKLFIRRRDGHRLTKAGLTLIPKARELESLLDGIGAAVGQKDTRTQGRVRIATTEVGANWILLPALSAFHKHWPDIALDIDANPNATDLLDDGDTVALRFHRPSNESVVIKKLGVIPFKLYASKNRREFNGAMDARSARYIGWTGATAHTGMARWLEGEFFPAQPVVSLNTLQGHIEAARAGMGIAGLPAFVGKQLDEVIAIDAARATFSLTAWLAVPAQTRHVARIRAVARFIDEAFKQAVQ